MTKNTLLVALALTLIAPAALTTKAQTPPREADGLTGSWRVVEFPDALLSFVRDGSRLTGAVAGPGSRVEIRNGVITGNTLTFKTRSADSDRTVTFVGIIETDRIRFLRHVEVRTGGRSVATGLEGSGEPDAFTALPDRAPELAVSAQLTGRWQVNGFRNTFLNLVTDGRKVTGTVQVPTILTEIIDGSIDGNIIIFKTRHTSGDRTVSFVGKFSGAQITFTRSVEVRPGGDPGGRGFYGVSAPSTFTATRISNVVPRPDLPTNFASPPLLNKEE